MSFADWWSRRTATRCPGCGEPVPALARACPLCGAPNRTRAVWLGAAALVPVLAIGIGIAAYLYPRCCAPSAATGDFTWLSRLMADCDVDAATQQSTLYFLVIPLAAKAEDEESWRSKSRDEVGNAILLGTEDALGGLRSKALRLTTEKYGFNVRDGANALYEWSSSSGISRLTIPNSDSIDTFNVQFQTDTRKSDTAWGNLFSRRRGNCYWVSAIIGN